MKNKRCKLMLGATLLLLVVFAPSIYRTIPLANDAEGLITLASMREEYHTFSPLHWDSYAVSPNMAVWVLANFDWPYRNRNRLSAPLLNQAINGHAMVAVDPPTSDSRDSARTLQLVEILIDRGEPMDEYHDSLAPILTAVLNCDRDVVELLVRKGANSRSTVNRPGSLSHGMDAFEYASHLQKSEFYDCSDMSLILGSQISRREDQ